MDCNGKYCVCNTKQQPLHIKTAICSSLNMLAVLIPVDSVLVLPKTVEYFYQLYKEKNEIQHTETEFSIQIKLLSFVLVFNFYIAFNNIAFSKYFSATAIYLSLLLQIEQKYFIPQNIWLKEFLLAFLFSSGLQLIVMFLLC